MKIRVITSILGLALTIPFILLGGDLLKVMVFVLIIIAMSEVFKALSGSFKPVHSLAYIFAAVYMFFIDYADDYKMLTIVLVLMIITAMCMLVIMYDRINIIDACITVFGFMYIAMLLSTVYLVRNFDHGNFYVWLIFIAAWGCDTGALFAGKLFGKRKLTPKLSPKKTVEGAIGGTLTATVLAFIYGFAVSELSSEVGDISIISYCTIAGFFGSVFAQFGDLAASAIKRMKGIKDFGNLLPGHGGVMDRFDSILFTAPTIYLTILILAK